MDQLFRLKNSLVEYLSPKRRRTIGPTPMTPSDAKSQAPLFARSATDLQEKNIENGMIRDYGKTHWSSSEKNHRKRGRDEDDMQDGILSEEFDPAESISPSNSISRVIASVEESDFEEEISIAVEEELEEISIEVKEESDEEKEVELSSGDEEEKVELSSGDEEEKVELASGDEEEESEGPPSEVESGAGDAETATGEDELGAATDEEINMDSGEEELELPTGDEELETPSDEEELNSDSEEVEDARMGSEEDVKVEVESLDELAEGHDIRRAHYVAEEEEEEDEQAHGSDADSDIGLDCDEEEEVEDEEDPEMTATAKVQAFLRRQAELALRKEGIVKARAAGDWHPDELFLFERISMRSFEEIIPQDWKIDLRTLPDELFTTERENTFINCNLSTPGHGAKALAKLIDLCVRVRMNTQSGVDTVRPILREINNYIKWSELDGGYRHLRFLPVLTVVAAKSHQTIAAINKSITSQMNFLAEKHRQYLGVQDGAEIDANKRAPPLLYGMIIARSTIIFVTLDSANPNAPLRHMQHFDFNDKDEGVWNCFAVAIMIVCARNSIIAIKDELELEDPESDPDL